ncbi:MAG: hypothetical protein C0412_17720 [Flavobacterium sp.]|nr:hypothetical protein [Flavobacterium sp.]
MNIKKGERIWSVNPKTDEIEITKVKNLFVYDYEGSMIRAKKQTIDFQVTPDHNIPFKSKDEKWKFIKAKDIGRKIIKIPCKLEWRGKKQKYILLPIPKIKRPHNLNDFKCKYYQQFLIKDFVKLIGWYITEGYLNPHIHYGIEITQKSKENKKLIKSILNKLNIPYRIYKDRKCSKIVFNSRQIYEYLEKECGRLSKNKKIPREILNLNKDVLWELFNTLIKGDGNIRVTEKGIKRYKYVTVSEKLKDNIIELGLKLGFACYVSKGKDKAFRIYFRTERNSNWLSYSRGSLIKVNYKGKIYCPELEKNHILIIKRNGKVSCNGNSFGAVSKETKIALAKISSLVGTTTNTGEGGMLPEERQNAKTLIVQYSTSRFGINDEVLKSGDAIEIKIGQGGKVGQGGLLPADKVTEEIAKIRNVPMGKDIHSPPAHPDIFSIDDLKKKVKWLREITDGKPIIIKLGAGDVENDVKLALKAEPDAIAVDGMGGGTGAAPRIMLDNFGIPTLAALVKAKRAMGNSKQELIIGGGLNSGADVAKALALGADAVYMAFPLLISMGCIYDKLCYLGKCPFGITTQDPELRKRFNIEENVKKAVNLLTACTEEVKMAAAACGKRNVHELNKEDLRSLSLLIKEITGIPLV